MEAVSQKMRLKLLVMLPIHPRKTSPQRKGRQSGKRNCCRVKRTHCTVTRRPCANTTEQTTPRYATISLFSSVFLAIIVISCFNIRLSCTFLCYFQFVMDEITVKCLFFEFEGPGCHYNFTAKPEYHDSTCDGTKLFFSEINCPLQSEDDVLVCCIVGENDSGMAHYLA